MINNPIVVEDEFLTHSDTQLNASGIEKPTTLIDLTASLHDSRCVQLEHVVNRDEFTSLSPSCIVKVTTNSPSISDTLHDPVIHTTQ